MSPAPDDVRFASVDRAGGSVRIEYRWIAAERSAGPLIVFLHEGLGSVAMWKDFPGALCDAAGARGLVFSRPGNGRSTARAPGERWKPDYMHRQAYELMPAFFGAIGLDAAVDRPWLFGHSDGGSIALLFADRYPDLVSGLVVVAPHLFVEPLSIASIEAARTSYLHTDLRQRLARYHEDADSAFWGWNDIWLDPAFRAFDIRTEVSRIRCPVLAVQGHDDQYGTLEQVRAIVSRLPHARLVDLPDCGHAPHRDQPERLIQQTVRFIEENAPVGRVARRATSV